MAKGDEATAARVLARVVASVGIGRLAQTLQVSEAQLQPFVTGKQPMTLRQQRALALAAIALSDNLTALRGQASALLAQVRAAEDFETGVTQRHSHGPPTTRWR